MRRDSPGVLLADELNTAELPWDEAQWPARALIPVLEPMVSEARRARIAAVLAARLKSVVVVMDAPHDPHNAAAILRSCDAFGVQYAHVVPREEPFQVAATVAKGTERWIDVRLHESPEAAVSALRAGGYQLVASHPAGRLLPEQLAEIPRLALLLGNEHDGLSAALESAADVSVRIPMRGFVESLNVSVCAAVLLAAATTSRSGDLGPDERARLYARGLYRSLPRAEEILAALPAPASD